MASRAAEMLTAELQKAWVEMKAEMRKAGYDAILTCTHRSNDEQARLYELGRNKPGRIVTRARPGESKHNSLPAEAFDIAIMVDGKLDWNTNGPAWRKAAEIASRLGLKQLSFESCHFEWR